MSFTNSFVVSWVIVSCDSEDESICCQGGGGGSLFKQPTTENTIKNKKSHN